MSNWIKLFQVGFLLFAFGHSVNGFSKETILITTKKGKDFQLVYKNLNRDLSSSYNVLEFPLEKNYEEFKNVVKKAKPSLMILMDNSSVNFAKRLKKETNIKTPSIAVMGLNYKKILKDEKSICGISYEVPPFTLLTQARFSLNNVKLKRVLVFYRKSVFSEYIATAKKRLKSEGIELIAKNIESEGKSPAKMLLEKGADEFKKKDKYDGVLVLLDSGLINKMTFSAFWQKAARESNLPFIVGTEKLALPKMSLAVFGMSPDLNDLSDQTTQMVDSILEDGTSCGEIGVEELIGVTKIWNSKQAKEKDFILNPKAKENLKLLK